MKTKIIYISGGEIFNMNDVRDAFETVRRELQLSQDTVLFGVPVDADDALGTQFEPAATTESCPEPAVVSPVAAEPEEAIEPVKQEKPKRAKKKVVEVPEVVKEVKIETVAPVVEPEPEKEVIPILSVLGGDDISVSSEPQTANDTIPDAIMDDNTDVVSVQEDSEPIINISDLSSGTKDPEPEFVTEPMDNFDAADIDNDIQTIETQSATIQESDDEDDQLAKLLESVQSLHEDKEEPEPDLQVIDNTPDETDATLEKLATEFAENQDKIINTTKSSARGGRIGKLKNILPFKKSKHNDSSLMGDLFGWAGVAANDEEFAIPEFFPTAVKK